MRSGKPSGHWQREGGGRVLIDVRLFEPKNQQGVGSAGIPYSRRGADGAQAERQMVGARSESLFTVRDYVA